MNTRRSSTLAGALGNQMEAMHVKASKFTLSRLPIAQGLVPINTLTAIVARRTEWTAAYVIAGISLLATCFALRGMRKGYGVQTLSFEGGLLWMVECKEFVGRAQVNEWTLVGRRAQLHCGDVTWRLVSREPAQLAAFLQRVLKKPPTPMRRRGSARARVLALVAAGAGVATVVVGAFHNFVPAAVLGLFAFLGGLSFFGAYSQHIRA